MPMGYSSPQLREKLADLKNRDIREQAILSLRQQVQQMELSSVPRFLQHVSESSCEGSPKRYAVSLYGECAKKHGPLIIPDIPKIIGTILRELTRDSSSSYFYDTCAEVILDIVRYCGKESRQAEEVMDSIVQKMAPALIERCETLATGSAVCLEALVSCEKWKTASESTQRDVWRYTTQAVKDPLRTVAHLQLGVALARTNCTLLKENARSLLQAGLEVVAGAIQWQRRLFAVKLVREILSRCDESTFQAEVQNTEAALIACGSESMERVQMEMASLWTMLSALKEKWEPDVFTENAPSNADKRNMKGGSFTSLGTDTPGYEDNVLRSDAGRAVELDSGLIRPFSQRKLFYEGAPTNKLMGARYILPTNSSLARSREPFNSSTSKGSPKIRSPTKLARTGSDTSVASRNFAKKDEASSSRSYESKESPCTDVVLYDTAEKMRDDEEQMGTRQESSTNSSYRNKGVEQIFAVRRSASCAESDGSNRVQGLDDDGEVQVLDSVLLSGPGMFAEFSSPSIDSRETAGLPGSSNKEGQWEREGGHDDDMDVSGDVLPMETQNSIGSMMNDETVTVNLMGNKCLEARFSSSKVKPKLGKAVKPTAESDKQHVNSTIHIGATSLDSSHGSLSDYTSTTSSSAGQLGGSRLVKPLGKATGLSTSRSSRVTEEDMLRGVDPKQLLMSLLSSSSALNKTASTTTTVREEDTRISGMELVNERLSHSRSYDSSISPGKEDWSSCQGDMDNDSLVRLETEDVCESNLAVECRVSGEKSSNGEEKLGDRLQKVLELGNAKPADVSHEEGRLSVVDLVEDNQAEETRDSVNHIKNVNGKHIVTMTGRTQSFSELMQCSDRGRQQVGLKKRNKIIRFFFENTMTGIGEQFEEEDGEDVDKGMPPFGEKASLQIDQNLIERPMVPAVLLWTIGLLELSLQGCVVVVVGFQILLLFIAILKLSEIGLELHPT